MLSVTERRRRRTQRSFVRKMYRYGIVQRGNQIVTIEPWRSRFLAMP